MNTHMSLLLPILSLWLILFFFELHFYLLLLICYAIICKANRKYSAHTILLRFVQLYGSEDLHLGYQQIIKL